MHFEYSKKERMNKFSIQRNNHKKKLFAVYCTEIIARVFVILWLLTFVNEMKNKFKGFYKNVYIFHTVCSKKGLIFIYLFTIYYI